MTQNTFTNGFATASFCLIVTPNSDSFSTITVNARDNACPIVGVSSVSIVINVLKSTYAGLDEIMCEGVGATLNVTGEHNLIGHQLAETPLLLVIIFLVIIVLTQLPIQIQLLHIKSLVI